MNGIPLGAVRPLTLPSLTDGPGGAGSLADPAQIGAKLANDIKSLEIPQGTEFSSLLGEFVNSVQALGTRAEAAKDAFLQGQDIDLHEVMIAGEESGIAFDLLLEIRNKLIEAYKEIIRMPL